MISTVIDRGTTLALRYAPAAYRDSRPRRPWCFRHVKRRVAAIGASWGSDPRRDAAQPPPNRRPVALPTDLSAGLQVVRRGQPRHRLSPAAGVYRWGLVAVPGSTAGSPLRAPASPISTTTHGTGPRRCGWSVLRPVRATCAAALPDTTTPPPEPLPVLYQRSAAGAMHLSALTRTEQGRETRGEGSSGQAGGADQAADAVRDGCCERADRGLAEAAVPPGAGGEPGDEGTAEEQAGEGEQQRGDHRGGPEQVREHRQGRPDRERRERRSRRQPGRGQVVLADPQLLPDVHVQDL